MDQTYATLLLKPMLKVQEVAHLLGVNHKTVRERVDKGEIPSVRLGRVLRIPTAGLRPMLGL